MIFSRLHILLLCTALFHGTIIVKIPFLITQIKSKNVSQETGYSADTTQYLASKSNTKFSEAKRVVLLEAGLHGKKLPQVLHFTPLDIERRVVEC